MLDPVKTLIAEIMLDKLQASHGLDDLALLYGCLEPCPQPELGQYAIKTFPLAKELKQKPVEIAAAVVEFLSSNNNFIQALQAGPYINVTMKPEVVAALNIKNLNDALVPAVSKPKTKHRYLVEHSTPNTHKELHIGHARNSVLGDTLCRLLRQNGHDAHAQNYHGDEGAHVAKCLWYIREHDVWPTVDEDKGTWLGKIYVLSTQALSDADEDKATKIKAKISNILKDIEEQEGNFYTLWKETRQWSLDLFSDFYKWLDVHFDSEKCESDMSEKSLQVVDEYYKKGIFVKSQGAIGTDLSDQDLGFCLLRKSDGRGLYATKDIALALNRFEQKNPDTCIYVVDNRQSYHFKQVFATLALMDFKEAERCFHLAYDMVETKNGAMSSRLGNIVPIRRLMKELHDGAYDVIEKRYGTEWDEERKSKTAQGIAVSAVRYGMLKVDPERKIIFDLEEWLTLEGNTGPYLQYVFARMSSLQRKSSEKDVDLLSFSGWGALKEKSELQLLSHLSAFNEIIEFSCDQLKPNLFANYTYDLARKFNSFYTECPILSEEDQEIRLARQALLKLSSIYFGKALDLMGIPKLEQM